VEKTLQQIRDANCRVGLTLNPETDFKLVEPFLDQIDMLLIMTVHPGFGGQSFRAEQMEKVKRAVEWNRSRDRKIHIQVDGGINSETARPLRTASPGSGLNQLRNRRRECWRGFSELRAAIPIRRGP